MPKPAEFGDPTERRHAPRVNFELSLAVPVHLRSDLGFHRGIARNISEGGMLVELEAAPPIGSTVEVTIASGYGPRISDTFTLLAEVRHQLVWSFIGPAGQDRLRGIGLRFVGAVEDAPAGQWIH